MDNVVNKKAYDHFEKVCDAISITQKFFSLSFSGGLVNYQAVNKRVISMELDELTIYCIYDSEGYDILLSTEKFSLVDGVASLSGVLVQ